MWIIVPFAAIGLLQHGGVSLRGGAPGGGRRLICRSLLCSARVRGHGIQVVQWQLMFLQSDVSVLLHGGNLLLLLFLST